MAVLRRGGGRSVVAVYECEYKAHVRFIVQSTERGDTYGMIEWFMGATKDMGRRDVANVHGKSASGI